MRRASYPKASVDVYCVVLEADGGELAVATTAAALALADAGIELCDLVAACSLVRRIGLPEPYPKPYPNHVCQLENTVGQHFLFVGRWR